MVAARDPVEALLAELTALQDDLETFSEAEFQTPAQFANALVNNLPAITYALGAGLPVTKWGPAVKNAGEEERVLRAVRGWNDQARVLVNTLVAGRATLDEFVATMESIFRRQARNAYIAGRRAMGDLRPLTDDEETLLDDGLDGDAEALRDFLNPPAKGGLIGVIGSMILDPSNYLGSGLPGDPFAGLPPPLGAGQHKPEASALGKLGQKLTSYGDRIRSMSHVGELDALAGAIPQDATLVWWSLNAADHCIDCVRLSDASPFYASTLGGNGIFPGSGHTRCGGRCRCMLEYDIPTEVCTDPISGPGSLGDMSAGLEDLGFEETAAGDRLNVWVQEAAACYRPMSIESLSSQLGVVSSGDALGDDEAFDWGGDVATAIQGGLAVEHATFRWRDLVDHIEHRGDPGFRRILPPQLDVDAFHDAFVWLQGVQADMEAVRFTRYELDGSAYYAAWHQTADAIRFEVGHTLEGLPTLNSELTLAAMHDLAGEANRLGMRFEVNGSTVDPGMEKWLDALGARRYTAGGTPPTVHPAFAMPELPPVAAIPIVRMEDLNAIRAALNVRFAKTYTAAETKAIQTYVGRNYVAINHYLRTGELLPHRLPLDLSIEDVEATIHTLDAVINAGALPEADLYRGREEGLVLYRGLAKTEGGFPRIGDVIADDAYWSTSFDPEVARSFAMGFGGGAPAHGTVYRIHVPEGYRGLFVNPAADLVGNAEGEVLLPRGSRFRVTRSALTDDGTAHIVDLEVIPHAGIATPGILPEVAELAIKPKGKLVDVSVLVPGATAGKKVRADKLGQRWLFKPAAAGQREVGATAIASELGLRVVPVQAAGAGTVVPIIKARSLSQTFPNLPEEFLSGVPGSAAFGMTPEQLDELGRQSVFDFVAGNHDAHLENFLIGVEDGALWGIDKSYAFGGIGLGVKTPTEFFDQHTIFGKLLGNAEENRLLGKLDPSAIGRMLDALDGMGDQEFLRLGGSAIPAYQAAQYLERKALTRSGFEDVFRARVKAVIKARGEDVGFVSPAWRDWLKAGGRWVPDSPRAGLKTVGMLPEVDALGGWPAMGLLKDAAPIPANDLPGMSAKRLLEAPDGRQFLLKTDEAVEELAAGRLAERLGLRTPPQTAVEEGALQPIIPKTRSLALVHAESGLTSTTAGVAGALEAGQIEELSRHSVLDFVIANADSHRGNWLIDADGRLWGIDKGRSFRGAVSQSPDPRSFWAVGNGQWGSIFGGALVERTNLLKSVRPGVFAETLGRLAAITDKEFADLIGPDAIHAVVSPFGDDAARLKDLLGRKAAARSGYEKLMAETVEKAGKDAPAEWRAWLDAGASFEHIVEPLPVLAPEGLIPAGELPKVKMLGGSTGAKLVEDPATGRRFVDKFGNSPDHIREEDLADRAYEAAGLPVPEHRLIETADGPLKRAKYIDDAIPLPAYLKDASAADKAAIIEKLQDGMAVDALLANWDVIGLVGDNILVRNGIPIRIDNGGSLRFRAQGAPKGKAWGDQVTELTRFRNTAKDDWTTRMFGSLSDERLRAQILALDDRRAAILAVLPADLQETVGRRLDDMLAQTADVIPAAAAGAVPLASGVLPIMPPAEAIPFPMRAKPGKPSLVGTNHASWQAGFKPAGNRKLAIKRLDAALPGSKGNILDGFNLDQLNMILARAEHLDAVGVDMGIVAKLGDFTTVPKADRARGIGLTYGRKIALQHNAKWAYALGRSEFTVYEDIGGLFAHETGHALFNSLGHDAQTKVIALRAEHGAKAVSGYAAKDVDEWVGEVFAAITTPGYQAGAIPFDQEFWAALVVDGKVKDAASMAPVLHTPDVKVAKVEPIPVGPPVPAETNAWTPGDPQQVILPESTLPLNVPQVEWTATVPDEPALPDLGFTPEAKSAARAAWEEVRIDWHDVDRGDEAVAISWHQSDAEEARKAGLAVEKIGKEYIVGQTSDSLAPLRHYIEAGGSTGDDAFWHLLGYSPENLAKYDASLAASKSVRLSAGVIIAEPDGRLWVLAPKNKFGGYENTWIKGGVDQGEAAAAGAVREVREEIGLSVELDSYLGDYANESGSGITRFYIGHRTGGGPLWAAEKETYKARLLTADEARVALKQYGKPNVRDQKILDDAVAKLAGTPGAPVFMVPPEDLAEFAAKTAPSVETPSLGPGKYQQAKVWSPKAGATPGPIPIDNPPLSTAFGYDHSALASLSYTSIPPAEKFPYNQTRWTTEAGLVQPMFWRLESKNGVGSIFWANSTKQVADPHLRMTLHVAQLQLLADEFHLIPGLAELRINTKLTDQVHPLLEMLVAAGGKVEGGILTIGRDDLLALSHTIETNGGLGAKLATLPTAPMVPAPTTAGQLGHDPNAVAAILKNPTVVSLSEDPEALHMTDLQTSAGPKQVAWASVKGPSGSWHLQVWAGTASLSPAEAEAFGAAALHTVMTQAKSLGIAVPVVLPPEFGLLHLPVSLSTAEAGHWLTYMDNDLAAVGAVLPALPPATFDPIKPPLGMDPVTTGIVATGPEAGVASSTKIASETKIDLDGKPFMATTYEGTPNVHVMWRRNGNDLYVGAVAGITTASTHEVDQALASHVRRMADLIADKPAIKSFRIHNSLLTDLHSDSDFLDLVHGFVGKGAKLYANGIDLHPEFVQHLADQLDARLAKAVAPPMPTFVPPPVGGFDGVAVGELAQTTKTDGELILDALAAAVDAKVNVGGYALIDSQYPVGAVQWRRLGNNLYVHSAPDADMVALKAQIVRFAKTMEEYPAIEGARFLHPALITGPGAELGDWLEAAGGIEYAQGIKIWRNDLLKLRDEILEGTKSAVAEPPVAAVVVPQVVDLASITVGPSLDPLAGSYNATQAAKATIGTANIPGVTGLYVQIKAGVSFTQFQTESVGHLAILKAIEGPTATMPATTAFLRYLSWVRDQGLSVKDFQGLGIAASVTLPPKVEKVLMNYGAEKLADGYIKISPAVLSKLGDDVDVALGTHVVADAVAASAPLPVTPTTYWDMVGSTKDVWQNVGAGWGWTSNAEGNFVGRVWTSPTGTKARTTYAVDTEAKRITLHGVESFWAKEAVTEVELAAVALTQLDELAVKAATDHFDLAIADKFWEHPFLAPLKDHFAAIGTTSGTYGTLLTFDGAAAFHNALAAGSIVPPSLASSTTKVGPTVAPVKALSAQAGYVAGDVAGFSETFASDSLLNTSPGEYGVLQMQSPKYGFHTFTWSDVSLPDETGYALKWVYVKVEKTAETHAEQVAAFMAMISPVNQGVVSSGWAGVAFNAIQLSDVGLATVPSILKAAGAKWVEVGGIGYWTLDASGLQKLATSILDDVALTPAVAGSAAAQVPFASKVDVLGATHASDAALPGEWLGKGIDDVAVTTVGGAKQAATSFGDASFAWTQGKTNLVISSASDALGQHTVGMLHHVAEMLDTNPGLTTVKWNATAFPSVFALGKLVGADVSGGFVVFTADQAKGIGKLIEQATGFVPVKPAAEVSPFTATFNAQPNLVALNKFVAESKHQGFEGAIDFVGGATGSLLYTTVEVEDSGNIIVHSIAGANLEEKKAAVALLIDAQKSIIAFKGTAAQLSFDAEWVASSGLQAILPGAIDGVVTIYDHQFDLITTSLTSNITKVVAPGRTLAEKFGIDQALVDKIVPSYSYGKLPIKKTYSIPTGSFPGQIKTLSALAQYRDIKGVLVIEKLSMSGYYGLGTPEQNLALMYGILKDLTAKAQMQGKHLFVAVGALPKDTEPLAKLLDGFATGSKEATGEFVYTPYYQSGMTGRIIPNAKVDKLNAAFEAGSSTPGVAAAAAVPSPVAAVPTPPVVPKAVEVVPPDLTFAHPEDVIDAWQAGTLATDVADATLKHLGLTGSDDVSTVYLNLKYEPGKYTFTPKVAAEAPVAPGPVVAGVTTPAPADSTLSALYGYDATESHALTADAVSTHKSPPEAKIKTYSYQATVSNGVVVKYAEEQQGPARILRVRGITGGVANSTDQANALIALIGSEFATYVKDTPDVARLVIEKKVLAGAPHLGSMFADAGWKETKDYWVVGQADLAKFSDAVASNQATWAKIASSPQVTPAEPAKLGVALPGKAPTAASPSFIYGYNAPHVAELRSSLKDVPQPKDDKGAEPHLVSVGKAQATWSVSPSGKTSGWSTLTFAADATLQEKVDAGFAILRHIAERERAMAGGEKTFLWVRPEVYDQVPGLRSLLLDAGGSESSFAALGGTATQITAEQADVAAKALDGDVMKGLTIQTKDVSGYLGYDPLAADKVFNSTPKIEAKTMTWSVGDKKPQAVVEVEHGTATWSGMRQGDDASRIVAAAAQLNWFSENGIGDVVVTADVWSTIPKLDKFLIAVGGRLDGTSIRLDTEDINTARRLIARNKLPTLLGGEPLEYSVIDDLVASPTDVLAAASSEVVTTGGLQTKATFIVGSGKVEVAYTRSDSNIFWARLDRSKATVGQARASAAAQLRSFANTVAQTKGLARLDVSSEVVAELPNLRAVLRKYGGREVPSSASGPAYWTLDRVDVLRLRSDLEVEMAGLKPAGASLSYIGEQAAAIKWPVAEELTADAATAARLGGQTPKALFRDKAGNEWLFKPGKSGRGALTDKAAADLAQLLGLNVPPVRLYTLEVNGELVQGSLQKMLPKAKSMERAGITGPAQLNPEQTVEMIHHSILDWVVNNDDAHIGNWMLDENGKLWSIDKSRGWQTLNDGVHDVLSTANKGNRAAAGDPWLFEFWRAARKDPALLAKVSPQALAPVLRKLRDLDDAAFIRLVEPIVNGPIQNAKYKSNPKAFLADMLKRKRETVGDFERYFTGEVRAMLADPSVAGKVPKEWSAWVRSGGQFNLDQTPKDIWMERMSALNSKYGEYTPQLANRLMEAEHLSPIRTAIRSYFGGGYGKGQAAHVKGFGAELIRPSLLRKKMDAQLAEWQELHEWALLNVMAGKASLAPGQDAMVRKFFDPEKGTFRLSRTTDRFGRDPKKYIEGYTKEGLRDMVGTSVGRVTSVAGGGGVVLYLEVPPSQVFSSWVFGYGAGGLHGGENEFLAYDVRVDQIVRIDDYYAQRVGIHGIVGYTGPIYDVK